MLEINNLNKSFDFNYILHDINLHVSENEIVQISGINGSGKSTFLKIISGILKPESGTISIINKNLLSRDCQSKKHIIYWGHNPMLYPHLTTYENIIFSQISLVDRQSMKKINMAGGFLIFFFVT